MNSLVRIFKAAVISSFTVIQAYFLLLILSGDPIFNVFSLFGAVFAYGIAVICMVSIGIPLHLFMLYTKLDSYMPYVTIGFLIPAIFVVWSQLFGKDGVLWVTWQAFVLSMFGAFCAFIFWKITRNQSAQNSNRSAKIQRKD